MIKYRDECCHCATTVYPCFGNRCPNRNVPYIVCDKCNQEDDEIYDLDGEHLCRDCLLETVPKVRIVNDK